MAQCVTHTLSLTHLGTRVALSFSHRHDTTHMPGWSRRLFYCSSLSLHKLCGLAVALACFNWPKLQPIPACGGTNSLHWAVATQPARHTLLPTLGYAPTHQPAHSLPSLDPRFGTFFLFFPAPFEESISSSLGRLFFWGREIFHVAHREQLRNAHKEGHPTRTTRPPPPQN